jgi:membrane protease YdiL (CAAX protease family)
VRIALLVVELAIIFVCAPLLIYERVLPNLPIPFLLAMGLIAFFVLRHSPSFNRTRLWNAQGALQHLPPLLLRDIFFVAVLVIAVWQLKPELLFSLIRRAPVLWAAIMLLYPILSVYPQEVLFRAYFFQRYAPLFGSGWIMIVASALAFGFVHIVFGNWISVVLSSTGGILFALTYRQSNSLLLVCIDHAIFGNFIFTIGLGEFFYHGMRW